MEFFTKGSTEDRNPRRKSIGTPGSPYRDAGDGGSRHAGGKARRFSVGIPSSRMSMGEEGVILPNYLRASTGSCHDFCKYGRKHEQLKSRSPIIPKRPAIVVSKEKITKTVAPVERKKTMIATKLKPFPDAKIHAPGEPIVSKRSSSTSRKVTENDIEIPEKRTTFYVKPKPVIVNPSSPDASAGSNGGRRKKDIKTVGTILQEDFVKKVMAKATPCGSVSHEPSVSRVISSKSRKCTILELVSPLKNQNWMPDTELKQPIANKVQEEILHVVDSKSEDRDEPIEMKFVPPPSQSAESIFPQVSESSGSSSHKVLEEEPSIAPPVFESSQHSSKNEVLEEDFECTDDEVVQSSEEEFEYTDNEEAFVSENDDEIETSEGNHNKNPRKGGMVVFEGKDDEAVKLKFKRGKILDLQSENNGPRRLKFRRGRVMAGNEHRQTIARRTYKKKDIDEATNDSNNGSGSVVLKHQVVQGKKDAQGLFNNVIEETASKLVESRKSKVKALVGAFETVISLQDVKPPSS